MTMQEKYPQARTAAGSDRKDDRQDGRQPDRQAGNQTGRQAVRQSDRQAGRKEQTPSQGALLDQSTWAAPKKSLGQHFLRNPDICQRIADLALPHDEDQILEIGPGPGALTKVLERMPHAHLLLLEKDSHWARVRSEEGGPRTEVRCMDALQFPWEELEGAWKVVGNLPYNVASPLIWDIAARCHALERAVFMVQKEVGQRLAARPGTKDYGALSVWVQAHLVPHLDFVVKPGAFLPPPKVDSAVLSFVPRPLAERPVEAHRLARVLKICFQQRRKQLGGLLRKSGETALLARLEALGLPLTARPEELSVTDFLNLSETSPAASSRE